MDLLSADMAVDKEILILYGLPVRLANQAGWFVIVAESKKDNGGWTTVFISNVNYYYQRTYDIKRHKRLWFGIIFAYAIRCCFMHGGLV